MGIWDRFKTANVMGVRNYIKEGHHILQVKRCEMGMSTNPQKKGVEKAVVEFKIIESDTMKVGQLCSLVEMDTSMGYAGNVLAFVAGIMGYDVEALKEDPDFESVFDGVWKEQQILVDMLVDCTAQQVKTTKGGDYTAKSWEPILASDYEKWALIAPDGSYTGEEPEGEGEGDEAAAQ